jgi:hypothetical protein
MSNDRARDEEPLPQLPPRPSSDFGKLTRELELQVECMVRRFVPYVTMCAYRLCLLK